MCHQSLFVLLRVLGLVHLESQLALGSILKEAAGGRTRGAQLVVETVDLDPANVRVLAVLVVFDHFHADNPSHEGVAVLATAGARDRNIDPAAWADEFRLGELEQVVLRGAGLPDDLGGCVGFVLNVVDVEAQGADLDLLDESHGQAVGLHAVGPVECMS